MPGLEVTYTSKPLRTFARTMGSDLQVILVEVAEFIEMRAKQLVPVVTGNLRDSIRVIVQGWQILAAAGADYASMVEFGTTVVAARPYLIPAIEEGARLLWRRIAELFERAR